MTLTNPELARIFRGFALMLHSGISVPESAFLLAREEEPSMETLLNALGEFLKGGAPLAEALAQSGVFPEYALTMVHIGERTGRLEDTLNALADQCEENHRTARSIRGAVAYPAMVMVLMLLVVGVLLVKVLPVFDGVYASLGTRLTGPGAGLLYAGQLLEKALPALGLGLAILATGAAVLKFSPTLRERVAASWRKRCGDRGISRSFNNARFARGLALGLSSGLALEESMELAGKLLEPIPGAAGRCRECLRALEAGETLADAMERGQFLTPAQSRLLQVGLRSGCGDRVMQTLADTLTEDAREQLDKTVGAIEPVMVLISSLLVGLILLSVMLPLADILAVLG